MHIRTLGGWMSFCVQIASGAAISAYPEYKALALGVFWLSTLLTAGILVWWFFVNYRVRWPIQSRSSTLVSREQPEKKEGDNDRISMREAATYAYDRLDSIRRAFVDKSEGGDARLADTAHLLTHQMSAIYGRELPSLTVKRIYRADFNKGGNFSDGGNSFKQTGGNLAEFVDIQVDKADLEESMRRMTAGD